MARGGRRKRGGDRFFPQAHGPRFSMCPPEPPPPDMGWNGPPFPDGHPGCPDPELNLMDSSAGFRPMMVPDYAPMDELGFGPVDQDFRPQASRLGGPRLMLDRDYDPYADMGRDPPRHRYGHIDPRDFGPMADRPMITEHSEYRVFDPSVGERDFGPMEPEYWGPDMPMERDFGQIRSSQTNAMMDRIGPVRGDHAAVDRNCIPTERGFSPALMRMERGLGTMNDREFGPPSAQCSDEHDMLFGGQRAYHGPPDEDMGMMGHDHGPTPRITEAPRWIDNSSDYGFIERDDLKKIHFSFEAFWGDKAEMLPGVRVQFTVLKEKGKECATDVVVPPGGTEEIDSEMFQGVVSKLPDSQVRKLTLPKYTGRIQATLFSVSTELPFSEHDYRPTLLLGDRVQFNLLTNLVTKQKRAVNISLMPNTFQFTAENREMGILMNTKNGSGSIMSEEWGKLWFDADENLDEAELKIMDEVEFTVILAKEEEQQKAIRVRKLPEGTVKFGQKTREKIAEALQNQDNPTSLTMVKGKWKAVTSEVLPQRTVVFEDISSEQYEGTVIKTAPKVSERKQGTSELEPLSGLLVATVAGVEKKLPFSPSDVLSEATMIQGDQVQFSISTNRSTRVERATNIEFMPDTIDQSKEQREKGVVVDLRESFGFIKCQQDPRMFFHLKEVMEESKVSLMDEVEFTILPASGGEGDRAIRVKKLLWTAFTATPKLEGLGAAPKEKKKMTIKLLRDSVNEEMKNLKVKIESFSTDDFPNDPIEPLDGNASPGKPGAGGLVPLESENDLQLTKIDKEGDGGKVKGQEKTVYPKSSPSSNPSKQKEEKRESKGRESNGSMERNRSSRAGKYRSPGREYTRRRSRSRSFERGHRYERRRSRSHSHERNWRDGSGRRRSRSHSRERGSVRTRRRSSSRERAATRAKRRSRSPEWNSSSRKKSSPFTNEQGREPAPKLLPGLGRQELPRSDVILDEELSRKKRELELLEEHIARKRAIIAMEQKGLGPKVFLRQEEEEEAESGYFRYRLPQESENPARPAPQPIKSILKKPKEPFAETDFFQQSEFLNNPPIKQTVSRSHLDPPTVDHPPHHPISGHQSHFGKPSDHPSLSQAVPQLAPIHHPPQLRSSTCQPAFDQPPTSYSPPSLQPPTMGNVSTQFERFLRTLNKGVDANLLSSIVKEVRKETGALERPTSSNPAQGESLFKDQDKFEDSYGRRPEEPDDFLLPHERAFQDGSGFSRILGMKHGPQVEETYWREGDVEDEERFLYGERASPGENERDGSRMAAARRLREQSPLEETEKNEEKMQHYDKIQSLLQTIGLDLDTTEVSKLADRTRERLYGKKQKAKRPGPSERESAWATSRSGRHRSRTDSPESDTRSISPVQPSRREVYMSYQGALEHSGTHDQERMQEISTLSRTVRSFSPSHSSPSTSQYSHVPPEPYSQYKDGQHEYAYSQHSSAVLSNWDSVAVQPAPAFSQLPSSFVTVPASPHGLPPFVSSPSQPHMPVASSVGLPPEQTSPFVSPPPVPFPPFIGQPPPAAPPFAGSASYYPLHPLTGAPIVPQASLGGTTFPMPQPVVGKGEASKQTKEPATTKSRCLRVIETVNLEGKKPKASTFLKEVPASTTESSGSTPAPFPILPESTERKVVPTISEDDIKAKQKKRLEQFNERMRQKKEQQKEAMRSRAESQKVQPGKTCTEVKNVWICGHSLVFWAEKRAKSPEYGMQLGMDPSRVRVWWKGMQGMTWDQLLPLLLKLKGNWPNPDVIILHLGGNDLGKSDLRALLAAVKKDLTSLRSIFPRCLLVWSDILPRRSWRTTEDAEAVESFRALVNKKVRADIAELGGETIAHPHIRPGSDAGLYRPDGVHLSGKGIDMFNIDMQDFLEKWEGEQSNMDSTS
ncbi:hypothetical protein JZ751_011163 [Albula glossodonta]|uniref:Cold-shock domain-containing protein n=1 Tax=Albula glossodonta TaxID=121402 RepID=A0A8T2NU56_9TELE|nr:hypothetical protein JZ751_011163 [Albula glossodonta]